MRSYLSATVFLLAATAAYAEPAARNAARENAADRRPAADREGRGAAPADRGGAGEAPMLGMLGGTNAMFAALDADGDGVITGKELRKAAAALKQLDTDKDGNISLAEANGSAGGGNPAGDAAQFIDRMMDGDKNKDSKLSIDELPDQMGARMVQEGDTDGDNALSRQELTSLADKMRNAMQGAGQIGSGQVWGGGGPVGGGGARNDTSQAGGIFARYDANGDGRLAVSELPADMVSALRNADKDGDHMISPPELAEFLAKMGDRARAFGAPGPNGAAAGTPGQNPPVRRPGR